MTTPNYLPTATVPHGYTLSTFTHQPQTHSYFAVLSSPSNNLSIPIVIAREDVDPLTDDGANLHTQRVTNTGLAILAR